jgi:hypothetical protein
LEYQAKIELEAQSANGEMKLEASGSPTLRRPHGGALLATPDVASQIKAGHLSVNGFEIAFGGRKTFYRSSREKVIGY